jgi:hypothetical protein
MKTGHLDFSAICDLYEGQYSTEEEAEKAREHIDSCAECSSEYDQLRRYMSLARDYRISLTLDDTFARQTMARYTRQRMRKRVFKAAPAAAAVFIAALTFTFFDMTAGKSPTSQAPVAREEKKEPVDTASSQKSVVSIIRESQGRVLRITDDFIEGEVTLDEFSDLRRKLGFRTVTYRITSSTARTATAPSRSWRNVEPVSAGGASGIQYSYPSYEGSSSERTVRFRVFNR